MSAAGRRDSGMTLMETLVVMAILGMVGTLSVVQLTHSLALYTLREAASVVTSEMKIARAQAMRSGQPIAFATGNDGRSFVWSGRTARQLPAGVSFTQMRPVTLAFYPDGTAIGDALTIRNTRGAITFAVNGATGAVTLR